MRTLQEQMELILCNFDFHKVHKVMECLDWAWYADGISQCPEPWEVREHALQRMKDAIKSGYSNTGGFEAKVEDGVLYLAFVVENTHGYEFWRDEDES